MSTEMAAVGSSLVARCVEYPHRWYDAWGPNVLKYILNPAALPVDDTTYDPTPEWTCTIVEGAGTSTVGVTDVAGGAIIIDTGTNDDDGFKMQLGSPVGGVGENVSFASPFPTYFGIRFALGDATNSDLLAGFCITNTACLDGVTDGMYFRTIDTEDELYFVMEQDSAESVTAVATLTDAAYCQAEFLYSGGNVYVYVNSVLVATIANTDANFCNDELLRLTLEFLTGEGNTNTATITELRFIQIQN